MSIEHKSLRDEILFLIGRASAPLNSAEIYERAKLAVEMKQVSKTLCALQELDKIVRVPGDGRARYRLADGQRTPAPAGKAGRSKTVQVEDAAGTGLPAVDLPSPNDFGASLNGAAGKTQRVPDVCVPNLAQAMIEVSRDQLGCCIDNGYARSVPAEGSAETRWWIDQDGGLEISVPEIIDTVVLSRDQAQRMAAMVLGAHDALERA